MSEAAEQKEVSVKIVSKLSREWLAAKRAEEAANALRVQIEGKLLAAGIKAREEGSQTAKVGDYKITTTGKIYYRIEDRPLFFDLVERIPEELRPVKKELDETGAKWLRANRPELWLVLSTALKSTPGKVGFKIEETGK